MELTSIYIHVPFCIHRCGYCDFVTTAGMQAWIPAYVDALVAEIQSVCSAAPERLVVPTVYFGGGTPSLLTPIQLNRIMATIRNLTDLMPEAEITLEANPGTLSLNWLSAAYDSGINRLSLGMQSSRVDELRMLERIHTFDEVRQSVEWARQAGFDNLSLDLIFGLPNQNLEQWQGNLESAISLLPEHLSLYALTIEPGTPLEHQVKSGLLPMPADDLAADMYEMAMQVLEGAGYEAYEISNWAKHRHGKLLSSQHNLQYWRGLPYLGFGAGAHGYASGYRTANEPDLTKYIHNIKHNLPGVFPIGQSAVDITVIDTWTAIEEHMMVGLRLVEEGVHADAFTEQFKVSIEACFPRQIARLTREGLLEWYGAGAQRCLRLTRRGRLLGNRVFMEFIGNTPRI